MNRLRSGEWLAGVAGAVLLASLFLPWFSGGADACPASPASCPPAELSGWEAFAVLDVLLALAGAGGVALLVAAATQRTPAVPVATAAVTTLVAIAAALGAAFRTIDPPGAADGLDRAWAYLGLAAALALAVGALCSVRSETPP